MSERADPSPLDVPLSRRDLLEILEELAVRRLPSQPSPQTPLEIAANALAQKFRARWTKQPARDLPVPE